MAKPPRLPILVAVVLATLAAPAAHAQSPPDAPAILYPPRPKPVPFDREQQAIVEQTLNKLIADIRALGKTHPELAHMDDKGVLTRGPGWFRYEYKVTLAEPAHPDVSVRKVAPGGCGIYFAFMPENTPDDNLTAYDTGARSFDTAGGMASAWSVANGKNELNGLVQIVLSAISSEMDASFDLLASEYTLEKKGITDTGAIIALLAERDWNVTHPACRVLAGRTLTQKEQEQLKNGFLTGAFRPGSMDFPRIVKLLQNQDAAHFPAFANALVKASLGLEAGGHDTLEPVPMFGVPWTSELDTAREVLIYTAGNDLRLAPAAELMLKNDPEVRNRIAALDYLMKLPAKERTPWLAAALQSPYRSVQAKAVETAVKIGATGVEKELVALLASPSSDLRHAARAAVVKLGLKGVNPNPPRPLPDAVKRIADTLWQNGLRDEDVVGICARVDGNTFYTGRPVPNPASLPAGVEVTVDFQRDEKGNVIKNDHPDFTIVLKDPWRMTKMDAESVKKRAAQFVAGAGADMDDHFIARTGPYLIAAAMKLGDTATAQSVYEYLCNDFQSDDDILYNGLEGIASPRSFALCDAFGAGRDADALKAAELVLTMEKWARPRTFLWDYVKQAHQITADIQRRQKDNTAPPEVVDNTQAADIHVYEAYWREKFPDKKQRIQALIAQAVLPERVG
ncbi:MAG TPA: HEAT repeat domain-containing protein, partial [Chthoniobacteraceae bacterium]|nr:HEAT repeat domain-containing protein [Chthoniobacteraceae bacterium]